jgi:DNA polymerase-3 subunit gamma/tau
MSIALARRYRPRRFADLLVQDHVTAVLRGAVARDRIGHGYLLTGPRGVGKTTAARILAMALNCAHRDADGEPCGECASCTRIWNGSASLDVIEIDAASNRGVDDARDLRERAMYAASEEGHHKVYIVDEAHMLTREAWNALLKILEEPPPGVVFVFATTEPQKIAATAAPVLSRLQRFDFRRIGPTAIRDRLRAVLAAEGLTADDDALTLIARHADGGMRDALSVLDQCLSFGEGAVTADRVREVLGLVGDEVYAALLEAVAGRTPAAIFPLVERLMEAGADLGEFMAGAGEMLRALLMVQVHAEPDGLTESMRELLQRHATRLQPGDVLRMLRLLTDNEPAMRRSANARLVVETVLLRWTMLDRMVDLERVLATGVGGVSPAPRAPRTTPVGGVAAATGGAVPARRATDQPPAGPASPAPAASAPAAPAPIAAIAFTRDSLQEHWADVIAAVRSESRFLAEALAGTVVAEVAPPALSLELTEPNPLFLERLEQQAGVIEAVIGRAVAAPVRLRLAGAPVAVAADPRTRRISDASIRADRLKGFRAKDPTLDAAADELDLEIVE